MNSFLISVTPLFAAIIFEYAILFWILNEDYK
jgi:hypothetical protein